MPRFIDQIKQIEIITSPGIDNVKPQAKIKILGCLFNGRGNINNQINVLCSIVGGLFHIAHKYRKIMPQPARKDFVHAHILSGVNYILPIYAGKLFQIYLWR